MPEVRESEASFRIANAAVTKLLDAGVHLAVEGIEIDASEKEAARFRKGHPARDGLPYEIESDCTVKHGINKAQSPVYPPMWRTTSKTKSATNLVQTLALKGLSYSYRALILDLGPLFLSIQWLTHTSVQMYPRSVYESTIKLVNKNLRKARVGMAFVFKDHVFAFLSSDLVFQPTWATSRAALPPPPSDFYSANWDFLDSLANWIRSRPNCDRNSLACDVIRSTRDVFLGIGVYTVNELFFLAGLSLLLTEAEVFSNPSRTARFAAAYLQYLHRSRTGLSDLLRPAMKDGYLAPTVQQRMRYLDWLHVYAKDQTKLPTRMAVLVDDYTDQLEDLSGLQMWFRYDMGTLYDVFEPTYVTEALSLPHNLGHLIFGHETWVELGGRLSDGSDALTSLFSDEGLLDSPTFLRPDHYSPLFLPPTDMNAYTRPRRYIHAYRARKQMWSITPFPLNSQGRSEIEDAVAICKVEGKSSGAGMITEVKGEARCRTLFSYIVQQTRMVAIGPLEYCGNAHQVHIGSSTVIAPCFGDPTLPEYFAIRDLKTRILAPVLPGSRRPALSATEEAELDTQLAEYSKAVLRKRARDGEGDENQPLGDVPAKPKRSRLSADKRLALMTVN
ncbi:hypothetical protein B0H14DRAFT_3860345 [Mycena olivaceomarginata]|nr:hypothetical protein B0H14DRAFT_3860345 [Mycena olivaceomarginata]